jgi:hypothetical protein
MKKLTPILLFICNVIFSQLNLDSIEMEMIQLTRNDRDSFGTSYLYTSDKCKKTSEVHLAYTLKFLNGSTLSHNESIPFHKNYVLTYPSDRYALFNKDSIKVQIGNDYYKKAAKWKLETEIMTGCYVSDINVVNINKIIAKKLFNNFKNSSSHYHIMTKNINIYNVYRGYLSVDYKKENINGQEIYLFYCVGIFDKSIYLSSEPKEYKKSKESNYYFD